MTEAHVPGHTTSTSQRPAIDFGSPVELLDLVAEGKQLLAEAGDNASRRAAKTLGKNDPLSVVLLAVLSGTDIRDHSVHGAAVIQVLKGQVHISMGDAGIDVATGNAITLAAGVEHQLSAPEDALLLLVIAGT